MINILIRDAQRRETWRRIKEKEPWEDRGSHKPNTTEPPEAGEARILP